MTATEIDKRLHKKFSHHKYQLSNSYIFSKQWESDFFSVLNSGYTQEIEVKVSYSDFKADFKKEDKHKVLELKSKGIKHYLKRGEKEWEIEGEYGITFLDENGRRVWDDETGYYKQVASGDRKKHKMCTNSPEDSYYAKNYFNVTWKQLSTEISVKEVGLCPNKFWYCCPEGIIPVEEVPEYAGLYYISNSRIKQIKAAPFIHKEKQDLTKILLDKFYYMSRNLKNSL